MSNDKKERKKMIAIEFN